MFLFSFLFFSCPHYSVVATTTLAVSFTHYRTCIRTSTCNYASDLCAVRDDAGDSYWKARHHRPLKVRGPCPDVEAEGYIHSVVGCIVLIQELAFGAILVTRTI
ncbi:hypothetical protein GGI42DRAFT_328092 [Trichoderma sp. SZMC 28013]